MSFKPQKVFSIHNSTTDAKIDGYFFSKKDCGYFSSKSGMVNYFSASGEDEYIVANKYGYIVYKKFGTSISLYSPRGEKLRDIVTYGYPYIKKDLPIFFVLTTNGRGISAYTMRGTLLFGPVKLSAIVTSVDCDNFFNILVSTSDGRATYYSKDGNVIHEINFTEDSAIYISKSVCLYSTKSIFAVCHGISPEYISILNLDNFKQIYSFKTQTNFRYENVLKFVDTRLYFEGIKKVNYINIRNKRIYSISVAGQIDNFEVSTNNEMLVSNSIDSIYHLDFFYKNGIKKLSYEFRNSISDFRFITKDRFFFKYDDKIYIMQREQV